MNIARNPQRVQNAILAGLMQLWWEPLLRRATCRSLGQDVNQVIERVASVAGYV